MSSHDRGCKNVRLISASQVLEAMRTRIVELENELAQQPPSKRARTSNASDVADASTSAGSGKADEKKRKMQVKKMFDRCQFFLS